MNTFLKKEHKRPLIVGLTGGIGSGKSTIAKVFKALGVPIFNSDTEAKHIINSDAEVIEAIVAQFGEVYDDGKLNAKKMADAVFKDKNALEKLNKIVHPKVAQYFEHWIIANKDAPILIKEAAILIESGAYKKMDKLVLVIASKHIRTERVMKRDGVAEEKVKERMNVQLSDDEKRSYADFVILNNDSELLIPQVLKMYKALNS